MQVSGTLVCTSLWDDGTHPTVHEIGFNKINLMNKDPLPWPKEIDNLTRSFSNKEGHSHDRSASLLQGQQHHNHTLDGSDDAWDDSKVFTTSFRTKMKVCKQNSLNNIIGVTHE
jgi:hypothetical protein